MKRFQEYWALATSISISLAGAKSYEVDSARILRSSTLIYPAGNCSLSEGIPRSSLAPINLSEAFPLLVILLFLD